MSGFPQYLFKCDVPNYFQGECLMRALKWFLGSSISEMYLERLPNKPPRCLTLKCFYYDYTTREALQAKSPY